MEDKLIWLGIFVVFAVLIGEWQLRQLDKRIKDLAHLFFEELATKDKAIYNNLPDIISHLSSGEMPVAEDTFQTSMRFIFKFVDKASFPSPDRVSVPERLHNSDPFTPLA